MSMPMGVSNKDRPIHNIDGSMFTSICVSASICMCSYICLCMYVVAVCICFCMCPSVYFRAQIQHLP
jgi:hypothetical protein